MCNPSTRRRSRGHGADVTAWDEARTAAPENSTRQLRVLVLLAEASDPLTVREVARELELARPTAHRILHTLTDDGWVLAAGSPRRYETSWRVAELGFRVATKHRARETVLEAAAELVKQVRQRAILSFYERGSVVCTDAIDFRRGEVVTQLIGQRFHALATASGRVALAYQSSDEVDRVLAAAPPVPVADEPESADEIRELLARIRTRGYEIRSGAGHREPESALGGLAVPVFDDRDRAVAVLGVTAPSSFDRASTERLLSELRTAAGRASADLGNRAALFA